MILYIQTTGFGDSQLLEWPPMNIWIYWLSLFNGKSAYSWRILGPGVSVFKLFYNSLSLSGCASASYFLLLVAWLLYYKPDHTPAIRSNDHPPPSLLDNINSMDYFSVTLLCLFVVYVCIYALSSHSCKYSICLMCIYRFLSPDHCIWLEMY